MSLLHLIPESGHQTAALLRQQAEILFRAAESLRRDFSRLQMAWQGGASESFHAEAQALMQHLRTQAEALNLLAHRLETEIQEWEAADRRGADSMRGLFRFALAWIPQGGGGGAPWPRAMLFRISDPFVGKATMPGQSMGKIGMLSLGSWLRGLPAWIKAWLDRLFPPEPIHSPIPDEPAAPKGRLYEILSKKFKEMEQKQASPSGRVIQRLHIEDPPPSASSSSSISTKPSYGHDVPFLSQMGLTYENKQTGKREETQYGCTPTSVSMILNYWHKQNSKYPARSPQELLDLNVAQGQFSATGMSATDLVEDVKELGYSEVYTRVGASWEELREEVKKGPVLVAVKLGMGTSGNNHAIVVSGISEDGSKVLVNDPWSGVKEYDASVFKASWNSVQSAYMVIRP